jgi:hypothetical protein
MKKDVAYMSTVEGMMDRIKQLEGYFNAPDIAMALHEGQRVAVLISRPKTTDPLTYQAQHIGGDKAGKNIIVPHDALTFLDPVVVTTQGYIQGLTDRIKELEGSRDWYKDAYETVTGDTNPL